LNKISQLLSIENVNVREEIYKKDEKGFNAESKLK